MVFTTVPTCRQCRMDRCRGSNGFQKSQHTNRCTLKGFTRYVDTEGQRVVVFNISGASFSVVLPGTTMFSVFFRDFGLSPSCFLALSDCFLLTWHPFRQRSCCRNLSLAMDYLKQYFIQLFRQRHRTSESNKLQIYGKDHKLEYQCGLPCVKSP